MKHIIRSLNLCTGVNMYMYVVCTCVCVCVRVMCLGRKRKIGIEWLLSMVTYIGV